MRVCESSNSALSRSETFHAARRFVVRLLVRDVDVKGKDERVTNPRWSGVFSHPLRAMKTPDQFDWCCYSRGGTTPAKVNRSVIRNSPGVADGNTGVQ